MLRRRRQGRKNGCNFPECLWEDEGNSPSNFGRLRRASLPRILPFCFSCFCFFHPPHLRQAFFTKSSCFILFLSLCFLPSLTSSICFLPPCSTGSGSRPPLSPCLLPSSLPPYLQPRLLFLPSPISSLPACLRSSVLARLLGDHSTSPPRPLLSPHHPPPPLPYPTCLEAVFS